MFPLSFLILLTKMLSLCLLFSLAKGLSILLIFSKKKKQLLVWVILSIVLFVYTWLISALNLFISCCLLLLGEFASFCSRAFLCAFKVLVYDIFRFFWRYSELWVLLFVLLSPWCPHKFWYAVPSVSLNSKSLFNFFLYFFLDQVIIE